MPDFPGSDHSREAFHLKKRKVDIEQEHQSHSSGDNSGGSAPELVIFPLVIEVPVDTSTATNMNVTSNVFIFKLEKNHFQNSMGSVDSSLGARA